jgi:hypothetical protein
MFGTFVPISTGHMPIDFHQNMEYYIFKRQKRIKNKTPLHVEKGRFGLRAAERVGILSAAYKSPRAAEVALTAGLNKSGGRSVKVQGICG